VPKCCDPDDYQSVLFRPLRATSDEALAAAGLTPAAQGIADFVASRGIERATVLEIGGGVGQLQVELLAGRPHVTNLEISQNYEAEAARLLGEAG
jgi:magnesium-protoporphyrin O-methyltransferase